MLYTFIFTGSHTIGNLVVAEAMRDPHREPSQLLAYRVPHSLNDQVQITTESENEAEGRALLRRACERLAQKFDTILKTTNTLISSGSSGGSSGGSQSPPTHRAPLHTRTLSVTVRTGTILSDSDIK